MQVPQFSARRRNRLTYTRRFGATIVNIGSLEIWDDDDLALVRDTLFEMIVCRNQRSVGIDMSCVKFLPSGFFGLLCEWYDKGVRIVLLAPQTNIRKMLWFREFFVPSSGECHLFAGKRRCDSPPSPVESDFISDTKDDWDDVDRPRILGGRYREPMQRLHRHCSSRRSEMKRLSAELQRQIVCAYAAGEGSYRQLAERFAVSKSVVGKVVRQELASKEPESGRQRRSRQRSNAVKSAADPAGHIVACRIARFLRQKQSRGLAGSRKAMWLEGICSLNRVRSEGRPKGLAAR